MRNRRSVLVVLLMISMSSLTGATVLAHEIADEMATAAQVWLDALDVDQRRLATFTLTDGERENWHFIPKPFEGDGMRGGIPLKAMRPDQRHLAQALLASGLSHRGYLTAAQIMSLERVLWELENESPRRDSTRYYVSIFGKPGSKNWGWRFEGHHLSMNFTIANGKLISGTPNFFASNPAVVLQGPRQGLQVLADEENLARELVQSLSQEQRKLAVVEDKAPDDILTSAKPTIEHLGDAGITFNDLKQDQQAHLLRLIEVYVHRVRREFANEQLAAIKAAGHDRIVFAWAGGIDKGQRHYYRVQGPIFLLEYANTQNDANHVHSVWRDFDGDFGRDLLKEHYQTAHQPGQD